MRRLRTGDQNVVRLQIAMHQRRRVRRGHALGDLHGEIQQLAGSIRSREGRSIHELHHQIVRAYII